MIEEAYAAIEDALTRFERGSGDNTCDQARAALASLRTAKEELEHRVSTLESLVKLKADERDAALAAKETAERERDEAIAENTRILIAHHDVTAMQAALNRMGRCTVCEKLALSNQPSNQGRWNRE